MNKRSEDSPDWDSQRMKIIGLGESSIRKSYYPELQQRIQELEDKNRELETLYAEQTAVGEELRRSEERFRNLIDASPVPVILARDRKFVYVNQAFLKAAGYESTDGVVGRDLLEFVAPEYREKVAGYVRARSRGEPAEIHYESVGLRKDGSHFPYEISVAVIGLSDGPVTMAFITDISERKAAEDAVRKSAAQLKRAEQIARIGHWEFDLGLRTVQASDGARAIYGLSGEQWTIPEVQKIPLPEYRSLLDEALRALVSEGRPYDMEFRIRRASDNVLLDIHSTAEYDPGTKKVFGIIRDITLQKRAEVTLRESENKYRGIVETTPDLIWEIDTGGRFTFMSPRISDLLGYSAEDLIGKSFISLLPPDQVPVAAQLFEKQVSAGQGLVTLETIAQHADGRRLEMEIRSAPAIDDRGRITGFRGITRDITEARRAATSLEQARKKLNLLNIVTFQDVQSAVFALSAYLVLIRQLRPEAKIAGLLDKEEEVLHKISSSLNFSRNYQDMGMKPPRWQNVSQAFLFAISHLDFLQVTHHLEVGNLEIYADPLLEKVFFNLMENALRHGKEMSEVRVWCQEKTDGLVLFVGDNGVGIPQEEKHMIFDRGYGKDTGLGLFLVREILSITGMSIRETGTPGKGTRFEILIPRGAYRNPPPE
ncbi:MAG: PAS domain S-box protein [Methanoregula sp.]|jgi:PAS domain S-box-containing protein|nr:PAS domain S-box protein [Methanoregula sp.]